MCATCGTPYVSLSMRHRSIGRATVCLSSERCWNGRIGRDFLYFLKGTRLRHVPGGPCRPRASSGLRPVSPERQPPRQAQAPPRNRSRPPAWRQSGGPPAREQPSRGRYPVSSRSAVQARSGRGARRLAGALPSGTRYTSRTLTAVRLLNEDHAASTGTLRAPNSLALAHRSPLSLFVFPVAGSPSPRMGRGAAFGGFCLAEAESRFGCVG